MKKAMFAMFGIILCAVGLVCYSGYAAPQENDVHLSAIGQIAPNVIWNDAELPQDSDCEEIVEPTITDEEETVDYPCNDWDTHVNCEMCGAHTDEFTLVTMNDHQILVTVCYDCYNNNMDLWDAD